MKEERKKQEWKNGDNRKKGRGYVREKEKTRQMEMSKLGKREEEHEKGKRKTQEQKG